MTGRVSEVPLGVEVMLPDAGGRPRQVIHVYEASTPLARQLARAHASLTGPGGGIKTLGTSVAYARSIRRLLAFLSDRGGSGPAPALSVGVVVEFLQSPGYRRVDEFVLRTLVRRIDELEPGAVPAALLDLTAAPALTRHRRREGTVTALSEGETRRVIAACKQAADDYEQRARGTATLVAGLGTAELPHWKERAAYAGALDRHGPCPTVALHKICGWPPPVDNVAYSREQVRRELYPETADLLPFFMLFLLGTGLSPEAGRWLRVSGVERIGADRIRLTWTKHRSVGRENDVFSDQGRWSPGAIVARVIDLTCRSRRDAAPDAADMVFLRAVAGGRPADAPAHWRPAVRLLIDRCGLVDDNGDRLGLDLRRLRKTYLRRLERRTHGAVALTAGINHSAQVAADHYLTPHEETELHSQVIERTQRSILEAAHRSQITVLDEHRARELAADPARAAAVLDVTPGRAASLLSSDEQDVFIAKCKNFYDSPHAKPGEPCPSAVWECLFCRQCVVTPTKLPNLLKLLDDIDGQARALTVEQWRGRYAAARAVIAERILPRFSDEVIQAARARIDEARLPPTQPELA
jgi:hypothetical protein